MRLKGKTAIIAGAARNIGRATALTFAREGANLVLVAKESRDELNALTGECEKLGVKALPIIGDVGNPGDVDRIVKAGHERFGYIDTLASVAAIRPHIERTQRVDDRARHRRNHERAVLRVSGQALGEAATDILRHKVELVLTQGRIRPHHRLCARYSPLMPTVRITVPRFS
jgi:NAD(P)-dependent dehydrogenase (short-subunit alcohol dehydrogenase family)